MRFWSPTRTTVVASLTLVTTGLLILSNLLQPVPPLVELLNVEVREAALATPNTAAESPAGGEAAVGGSDVSDRELAVSARPSAPLLSPASTLAPVSLSIPAISVAGDVQKVGLAADSVLDVPAPDTGGWYEHSAAPGERGATVIAAHADLNGQTALFFELRNLNTGDEILVNLSDGTEARYEVQRVELHDKEDLPQTTLFRKQGDHALHLITCGGTFDSQARSYRGNTVVIATPVLT